MNLQNAYAVAMKDLREVFSNIGIYGPMFGVPLFFAIVLPVLTLYIATNAAPAAVIKLVQLPVQPSDIYLKSLAFTLFFAVNVLGPIFMTMPIFTASVIAADSFVGEKERKTGEALLSMPISNNELLLGKLLASFIPAVILTLGVFALYGGVVDYLAYGQFHVYLLPTIPWLMMLAASPLLAIAAMGIVVFVSSNVKSIKEAQQISSLLVLPVLLMPFASIFGAAKITFSFMLYLIIGLAAADLLIIYIAAKRFKREAML
jgi:ABC-2 type transport system permease protein